VQPSDSDIWHFIYDEPTGQWSWARVAFDGEEVAESAYTFASFRVCVADAERAGFDPSTTVVRRLRSCDVQRKQPAPPDRRRRPRDTNAP
jgi:hypothetical protein